MRRYNRHDETDRRDDVYDEPHDDHPVGEEAVEVEHRRSRWWGGGIADQVNSVVALILLAVETLLGLRFLLVLFGANPDAGFVDFILDVTAPLLEPFEGAFANRTWDQGVIEVNTALAMGAYFVAGILLMLLVRAVTPRVREDRDEVVRRRHAHES